jgi:hypothetical protein
MGNNNIARKRTSLIRAIFSYFTALLTANARKGNIGKRYLPCIPLSEVASSAVQVTYWAVKTAINVIKAHNNKPVFNWILSFQEELKPITKPAKRVI